MPGARQHVVLCEGFDDRSFWRGWLLHLGCSDPTDRGRRRVNDAWGRPVTGAGRYLFRTPAGSDIIVQPFGGRSKARQAAEEYLGRRQAYRPARVVLNLDGDADDGKGTRAEDQIRGVARDLGAAVEGRGPYAIEDSFLYPVIWQCGDPDPTAGLPGKQTLERLAAAAILAAYSGRGPAVSSWLDAEPLGLKLPRSYGYSYFAKWYSNHGAANFYEALWQDEAVTRELKTRLEDTGASRYVDELVGD
jgi:hypothetical protein